jgi:hypothetical protein
MCDSTLQVPAMLLERKILSLSEVQDILREITYKPRYLFHFQYVYARETMRLSLTCFQPDAIREGEIRLTYTLEYSIREFEKFELIVEVLQQFFISFERHEMNEWLKYQGKCIRDPHPPEE